MVTTQTINALGLERQNQVAREDLILFINACFACSGQREFYSDGQNQRVSMDFLHRYILGNYRLLYARTLAAGVNHFNQAQIILNLLATGRETESAHRVEEGALIAAALQALPPQRAWRVLETLRKQSVNNRRTRAIVKQYLESRRDISFDAVKYRSKVRAAVLHTHLKPTGELGPFLFRGWQKRVYTTPLFETYRQGHYSAESLYKLPYTVAEGLAAKHGIARDVFLTRIVPQMTQGEKLRLQKTAGREAIAPIAVDWARLPLTRLAIYALSLTDTERLAQHDVLHDALTKAAERILVASPMRLGRVAAVLDASYSSSGSSEKRRRPLGVALASHYLLSTAAQQYHAFWTNSTEEALGVRARGQSDLATPILDALDWKPDLLVIVSDGCENDPPQGASEVIRVFRTKLDTHHRTSIIHCNPVFDTEDFTLRAVSLFAPTVGLRDAEDLPTMLGFAGFADGAVPLSELEAYLAVRVSEMLAGSVL